MKPLITKSNYNKSLKSKLKFTTPQFINRHQYYTDQTQKDLKRTLGNWSLNAGLEVVVALDKKSQEIIEKELLDSCLDLEKGSTRKYGGGAVLVKTHDIKSGFVQNRYAAIASRHTVEDEDFNWAVDGSRHFGSIYKWLTTLLYFEEGGTAFDTYYDVPRSFNMGASRNAYRPDNWKSSWRDFHGYYTYKITDMVTNFIQSKNVTYVFIAHLIGTQKLADFFNLISGFDQYEDESMRFQPYLSLVLGTMETSSVTFAQMLSVIANRGILKTITSIEYVIEYDGTKHYVDDLLPEKRVVSREAAEVALWLGYLNPYGGTAKRFIDGGIGKTGSSKTDAGFAAMSGRTAEQYIKENPKHILNSNLLYVVNIGVNKGSAPGLYGGKVGAINANKVFTHILECEKNKKDCKKKISGDLLSTFSDKFIFKRYKTFPRIGLVKVPILKGAKTKGEASKTEEELAEIEAEFLEFKEEQYFKRYGRYPEWDEDEQKFAHIANVDRQGDIVVDDEVDVKQEDKDKLDKIEIVPPDHTDIYEDDYYKQLALKQKRGINPEEWPDLKPLYPDKTKKEKKDYEKELNNEKKKYEVFLVDEDEIEKDKKKDENDDYDTSNSKDKTPYAEILNIETTNSKKDKKNKKTEKKNNNKENKQNKTTKEKNDENNTETKDTDQEDSD